MKAIRVKSSTISAVNFAFAGLFATMLIEGCTMSTPERKPYMEYYGSFMSYYVPLRLTQKISREQAEASEVYCIGYFDAKNRLVRVVKMFQSSVFFEHNYAYYPNGKLLRIEVKNRDGTMTTEEFDERGRVKRSSKP